MLSGCCTTAFSLNLRTNGEISDGRPARLMAGDVIETGASGGAAHADEMLLWAGTMTPIFFPEIAAPQGVVVRGTIWVPAVPPVENSGGSLLIKAGDM